jgi:hypothetical protein
MIHPCLFSGIVVIRSKQQGDDVGHKGKKRKKKGLLQAPTTWVQDVLVLA